MSDDDEGRVIPFPMIGLRPPIGDGSGTTTAPPAPPPAPPADPETEPDEAEAFPFLTGRQLAPPLALTLPALTDDEDQAADDSEAAAVHHDGGMTGREAATLGVMVASAIAVACLRGTAAFASWCRTRAEHHRTVREQAANGSGSTSTGGRGRVPSGPEFGRNATRNGGGGGRSGGGSGGGRGASGTSRTPATFRSGSGTRGAGGTRPGSGTSRPPSAAGSRNNTGPGRGGGSGSGSGSGSTPTSRRRRGPGGTGSGSGGGSGTSLRGPKGPKIRKPKGSGTGDSGGPSSSGSRPGKGRKRKGPKGSASPGSTSPKGKSGGKKGGKGKGEDGGSKSPATRTPALPPATRGSRVRALARRHTVRAARGGGRLLRRGGSYLRTHTPPAARRTGRRLVKRARHTRRWSRERWERICARAEARWERRQEAARAAAATAAGTAAGTDPTAPGSASAPPPPGTPPTGPGTGPGEASSGPGASPWGPGPGGGPWAGHGPLTPPPAVTVPYTVVLDREDDDEAPTAAPLAIAYGDTPPPDAPEGEVWEPLRGVDRGWVLVAAPELLDVEPVGVYAIPAARAEAVPLSKETTPVTELPATPSAIAEGVAAMTGPHYDSGASELTIYDLTDADEDAAAEIVARADTAREDARAAAQLVSHMEDLKATCIRWKIPGALYRYACRLQEAAALLAVDARALANELPAASEAIKVAGANAAARHKPLADTVRDLGHAAPAEADYHG